MHNRDGTDTKHGVASTHMRRSYCVQMSCVATALSRDTYAFLMSSLDAEPATSNTL